MPPTRWCAKVTECGKGRAAGGAELTEPLLCWVADSIGSDATIVSVRALHGDQGPWRLSVDVRGRREQLVLRSLTPRIDAEMIATGAAALEVAQSHELPAPRSLARDLDGWAAGVPVTLETFVDGSTTGPRALSVSRIRAAGAALAQVHAIPLAPRPDLPLRTRPIATDDFAGDRRQGVMVTSPLLRTADEWIQSIDQLRGTTVFVHGDGGRATWRGSATALAP